LLQRAGMQTDKKRDEPYVDFSELEERAKSSNRCTTTTFNCHLAAVRFGRWSPQVKKESCVAVRNYSSPVTAFLITTDSRSRYAFMGR